MKYLFTAVLALAVATGCGGRTLATADPHNAIINRTDGIYSDAQLQADWQQAQAFVATQSFPLNPTVASLYAPDPRAYNVVPNPPITVIAVSANVPESELLERGHEPVPTIRCPYWDGYCVSYITDQHELYFAISENAPRNIRYEMESYILWKLGYDVHLR